MQSITKYREKQRLEAVLLRSENKTAFLLESITLLMKSLILIV